MEKTLNILVLMLILNFNVHTSEVKKLNFKGRSSSIVLVKDQNSVLKIGNTDKVKAWDNESIVRYEGPTTGLSTFTNNGVYGYGTATGVQDPQIQLLTASSNAIKYLDTEMRTYSNSQQYYLHASSNAIAYLDMEVRTQSNWINKLGPAEQAAVIRENSNAFIYFAENTFGVQNLTVSGESTLLYDLFLHPNHKIIVNGNTILGGDGKTIHIARNRTLGNQSVIVVGQDSTLTFSNVTIDGMDDTAFNLASGASINFGDNTILGLLDDTSTTRDWMFTGSAIIDGNGKNMLLSENNSILATNRKTLTIRNTNLNYLKYQNLRCTDNYATIKLENSWVALDKAHAYQFGLGTLEISNDVKITGTGCIFGYTSRKPLRINANSMLTLDTDVTFSYAPKSNSRDLIEMSDMSSIFHINNCSLISTNTGMRLTKGTLLIDGKITFSNSAPMSDSVRSLSEGIAFGNGTLSDDLNIEIMPSASIDLQKGILSYDNVG